MRELKVAVCDLFPSLFEHLSIPEILELNASMIRNTIYKHCTPILKEWFVKQNEIDEPHELDQLRRLYDLLFKQNTQSDNIIDDIDELITLFARFKGINRLFYKMDESHEPIPLFECIYVPDSDTNSDSDSNDGNPDPTTWVPVNDMFALK